jgi:transposase InsO family protein
MAHPPRQQLTAVQLQILDKIVFDERNFVGRDKLWKIVKFNHPTAEISRRQVMDYIKGIETFQLYAHKKKTKHIAPTLLKKPFLYLALDLIDYRRFENDGYKWILTAIDMFTRQTWVEAMKGKTATHSTRAVENILKRMPKKPKALRSDNESGFKSHLFKAMIEKHNITHTWSTPYTPQQNGMVERFNGTIKRQLKMVRTQEDNEKWPEYLQQVNDNINKQYHRIIKMSPNDLARAENFDKGYKETKKEAKKRSFIEKATYKVGDLVRIKMTKADDYNWSKLVYRISKVKQSQRLSQRTWYLVYKTDKTGATLGPILTRKYYTNELKPIISERVAAKEPLQYEFRFIYEARVKDGRRELLVKFVNMEPTWEPYANILKDSGNAVRAFERNRHVRWFNDHVEWDEPATQVKRLPAKNRRKLAAQIQKKRKVSKIKLSADAKKWLYSKRRKTNHFVDENNYKQFVTANASQDLQQGDYVFYIWNGHSVYIGIVTQQDNHNFSIDNYTYSAPHLVIKYSAQILTNLEKITNVGPLSKKAEDTILATFQRKQQKPPSAPAPSPPPPPIPVRRSKRVAKKKVGKAPPMPVRRSKRIAAQKGKGGPEVKTKPNGRERWRSMADIKENTWISSRGRIKKIFGNGNTHMDFGHKNNEYRQTKIDTKKYLMHRLVAQYFIANPNEYKEVDHIDRRPANNCVANLRWSTRLKQMQNRDD